MQLSSWWMVPACAGRATIQAVLELSAQQAAGGPRQQGKQRSGEVVWYGEQSGRVMLSDRKLADQHKHGSMIRLAKATKGPVLSVVDC